MVAGPSSQPLYTVAREVVQGEPPARQTLAPRTLIGALPSIMRTSRGSGARLQQVGGTAIDIEAHETVVRATHSVRLAEEWATVVAASRIRHRLALTADGWAVVVLLDDGPRASAALAAYDEENRPKERDVDPPLGWSAIALCVTVALLLLGFFVLTGSRAAGVFWFEHGSASAERILRGEVWRTITALTLHADLGHALGNAIACVVLIPPVVQALGLGTGLWVLLVSGAIGNAVTALILGAPHNSIGASTLTFGAFGVLCAHAVIARWRDESARRRSWVVIVAGVLLLAMLGTAEGADILAHVFGLLAGVVTGLSVRLVRPRPFPVPIESTLAVGAGAVVLMCWLIA